MKKRYEYHVYTSQTHSSYSNFKSKSEALRFAAHVLKDGSFASIHKVAL